MTGSNLTYKTISQNGGQADRLASGHLGGLNNPAEFLYRLFDAALDACIPDKILPTYLPDLTPLIKGELVNPSAPKGRVFVIGAGKASAAMAKSVETYWQSLWTQEIASGVLSLHGHIITRYGYAKGCECTYFKIYEAAHPVPDENGLRATQACIDFLNEAALTENDIVICLISGGGSALLCAPPPIIDLVEKQRINKALLTSGAPISDMNCVRKHLSTIKGGRLAQICAPAQMYSLMISDVPGDDPAIIASGPTIADPTTSADALNILKKYHIEISDDIRAYLTDPANETPTDLPKNQHATIIASAQDALDIAAQKAKETGITPYILSDRLEGQARDCGAFHAALTRQILIQSQPFQAPCVILSGGETSVTVTGNGRGGRNSEFLLSFFIEAMDLYAAGHHIYAMACDTDGIDGMEDNAGAFMSPEIYKTFIEINNASHLNPKQFLDNNDAYGFFEKLGALVKTGPTNTNVNDFRAILIL